MRKFFLAVILVLLTALPVNAQSNQTCVYFFWQYGCSHCAQVKPFLSNLESKYENISILEFEISRNQSNRELLINMYEALDIPISEWGVPTVFIDKKVMIGDTPILNGIESKIRKCTEEGCACPKDILSSNYSVDSGQSTGFGHIKNDLTIPFVIGAALVDAINPCAFAVLIILLSTLLAAGKKKGVVPTGIAYISSIYLAYFMIGIGLFTVIQMSGLTGLVFKAVGILAIAVGLLNIKDFFSYGAGGFIMEVPRSWRPALKRLIRGVTSVPGAFATGLLVSLFLLPCTSGPYIVILGMLADTATRNLAIPILLLYNLVFVLPMFAIMLMVKWGLTTTEKAEKWRMGKIRYLHLIAGLIILGMGIAITAGIA